MKVAQVSPFLPSRTGGSVVYCTNLATHLEERGHDVEIFSSAFPPKDEGRQVGRSIRINASRCYGLVFGVNPITLLLSKIMHSKADVIHAHSYIFSTSNQAAFASRLMARPFVLHIHGATYVRQPMLDRKTSSELFLKEHVYDKTIGKWTIDCADAVAAVSQFDLQQCKEVFDVDRDKLHLLPNAVDTVTFRPSTSSESVPPTVTFIGRLEPWKGILLFMQIAERVRQVVPETVFQVVGGGSLRGQLATDYSEFDGNLRIMGDVNHERIASILQGSSVLVLPSYIEGLPTVCLEALACGIPVVASNVGGTPEVVIDGETGYLCPVNDTDAFADRVIKLLSDEHLRARMGTKGRAVVEKAYSWLAVAEKTEQLYLDLV